MTRPNWSPPEEHALASYLAEQVYSRASGRLEDECLRNYPRDVYFVGNLSPMMAHDDPSADGATPRWLGDLLTKLRPMAFGADFLMAAPDTRAEVEVDLTWACYFRVFPSFGQQRGHQQANDRNLSIDQSGQSEGSPSDPSASSEENEPSSSADGDPYASLSPQDRRSDRHGRDSLFYRFRKIACTASGTVTISRIAGTNDWKVDSLDLEGAVEAELIRAKELASTDPDRLRTAGISDSEVQVPQSAMVSEEAYSRFLAALQTEVSPQWLWAIRPAIKSLNGSDDPELLEMRFEFTNATPMSEHSKSVEPFLFDPSAVFRIKTGSLLVPYHLDQIPRGFQYDRTLWGRGFNCATVRGTDATGDYIQTNNTPIFKQPRYNTRTEPDCSFTLLASDPFPVLDEVLREMKAYVGEWETYRSEYSGHILDWDDQNAAVFDADMQRYEDEITRFAKGLALLRKDTDALLAFQLTNEVFRRGPNEGWRVFQLVFLLTQLQGILALNHPTTDGLRERERVDIVYFPTGGGKTEAYLAVTVFHCFYDRLRGKSAGVGVWARFPLRLLTVQQMQRFADVVGTAELVRLEQSEPRLNGPAVEGFSVGYFVGQGGTPNELKEPRPGDPPNADWSTAEDPAARQRWKTIMHCPACRTPSVSVDFDNIRVRLIHRCTNSTCRFPDGAIPVVVVDNEIYRYLPSVVVGTIDKLAALGNQRKFSLILGEIDGMCREHGYFKGRCCQTNCRDRTLLQFTRPPGASGPTLFVQDELHLLREGLGTFDSHYETFTQHILREFGQNLPLKMIASSATIEEFERQIEHLYGKERSQSLVFPAPGPAVGKSFYAENLDFPQRLYIGVIPHNKTIFNAILELLAYYQQAIQDLQGLPPSASNPYGGSLTPGTSAWKELLDLYATSVTYFRAGRDLNSIRTDLDAAVNSDLQRDGYRAAEVFELTGSTSTDEVTRILERLETPIASADQSDVVLATSMISHGVDVDRLNAMVFYGMPQQNAEYIQASSRVGRSHPGIVFTCLHPARERDQSHYSYFMKFHEYLGQLVEPVAINRWSKFSVQRTLPGLFMAVLLQLVANRSGNDNPNRYYMIDFVKREISRGNIRAGQFIDLLQQAYSAGLSGTGVWDTFADEISLRVPQFLDQIIAAGVHETFVSETLLPRPMNSLRDVDDLLEIEIDDAGARWASRSR